MKPPTRFKDQEPPDNGATFLGAITATKISEIQTDFDLTAANACTADLQKTNLFLLGEKHGVKENADIMYTLFKKFGFRNLALEWDPDIEERIGVFLDTGVLDLKGTKHSGDGRVTAEHFSLLKKLHSEQLLDTIICFDAHGDNTWDERDSQMAKNILKDLPASPTLVVAGNLHTKTSPFSLEQYGEGPGLHHPMGEHIKRHIPGVPTGRIEPLSGKFYNSGIKKISQKQSLVTSTARFFKSEEGVYVFELPEAHIATVPTQHNPFKR